LGEPGRERGASGETVRTLIVDDDATFRQLVKEHLACEADISVVGGAADGHDAVLNSTDIKLDLVLMKEREPEPTGVGFPGQRAPSKGMVILLAEDNEDNINTISDYLTAKGYHVAVARNGSDALERAKETDPDLILMDIQMPGMDGLEATRRIRADASLANVPIVALTALAMPGDRERCLKAGADDYMSKPVHLKGLLEVIEAQARKAHGAPSPRHSE